MKRDCSAGCEPSISTHHRSDGSTSRRLNRFPSSAAVGVTDCRRQEPRGALAAAAKQSLKHKRGVHEQTANHSTRFGVNAATSEQDLAVLRFGNDTHLWANASHLQARPCGPALRRLDQRLGRVPEDRHRAASSHKWKCIARVFTRTAHVLSVATEGAPHPCGEATVEGRAPAEPARDRACQSLCGDVFSAADTVRGPR